MTRFERLWVAPALALALLCMEGMPARAQEAPDPLIERVETLRREFDEARANIRALETRAREATGSDVVALRIKATEERLAAVEKLGERVDAVLELEAKGIDARSQRSSLAKLLTSLTPVLEFHLDAAEDSLAKLEAELESAAPEGRVAIGQGVALQRTLIGKLLSAGADLVDMIGRLELHAPRARELVGVRLDDRVVILSGRIELLTATLADAEARQAGAPEDTTIQDEIRSLRAGLDADTQELSSLLPLMDRLNLDTTEYKQLLISATGELTTDVFEGEVAKGLFVQWATGVGESVVAKGPALLFKVLLFLLVFGAFWLTSRVIRKITRRAVAAPHLRFSQLLKRMIVSVASGLVLLVGFLTALSQLGIQVGPLLAGLGIAGFIVGFALQETLANLAAGVMILAFRPFDVGDLIECAEGVFGRVSHMNLVSTTILTIDNQTRIVPNGKIWGGVITNVTAQAIRRVDLVFGISYTDDISKAEAVLTAVTEEHPLVLDDPEPIVKLHELGDSSVNFVVRPWCSRDDYWDVHWDITREVKLRFDREGISIPFPQRDVHLIPAEVGGGATVAAGVPASRMGSERSASSSHTESDSES